MMPTDRCQTCLNGGFRSAGATRVRARSKPYVRHGVSTGPAAVVVVAGAVVAGGTVGSAALDVSNSTVDEPRTFAWSISCPDFRTRRPAYPAPPRRATASTPAMRSRGRIAGILA